MLVTLGDRVTYDSHNKGIGNNKIKVIHLVPLSSRVDYFFSFLSVTMATIKVAKEIATIKASYTDIGNTPHTKNTY